MHPSSAATEGRPTYLGLVHQLSNRYPALHSLSSWIERQRMYSSRPVGCSVLEFNDDGVVNHIVFSACSPETDGDATATATATLSELAEYLASSSSSSAPTRRLYMLEDLSGPYIELFGSHLGIDAQVLAAHIHDAHWTASYKSGHAAQLPSLNDPEKSYTLRYYDARIFEHPRLDPPPTSVRTVANVSRNVTFLKDIFNQDRNGRYSQNGPVGTVRRNASFWCGRERNGGWSALLLLDPPILHNKLAFFVNGERIVMRTKKNRPYQGGYRDFTPWPDEQQLFSSSSSTTIPAGPHRISLADDIAYYWLHVASHEQVAAAVQNPYESTIFLRRIIAAMWNNIMEQHRTALSYLETKLWSMERMIDPQLTDAKKNEFLGVFTVVLNEINKIRRRTNWYAQEMKTNLEILGLPAAANSPTIINQSAPPRRRREEVDRDFLAIYERLLDQRAWAEKLLDITSTHLTLMETEKSISDSKSLSRLTILGFFFVPVSFVCSFFSMNGDFAVGESKFWVYFAVTVPLTVAILVVVFASWWYKRFREIRLARPRRRPSVIHDEPDAEKRATMSPHRRR